MSSGPVAPISGAGFRSLMTRWATGVSVVTAHDASGDAGMTVNALLSVSLDPPSLLISLTRDADTTPVVERSGEFAVSFLAAEQRSLSDRFAQTLPPTEKFAGVAFHRGRRGIPLLDLALGSAECRVVSTTLAFDHALFLGEVVAMELGPDRTPLVYHHSGYAELESESRLKFPPARR